MFELGMGSVRFACFFVGKPRKSYFKEASSDYVTKIRHFAEILVIYLKDSGLAQESMEYLKKRQKYQSFYHVVLDPRGAIMSSEELAQFIQRHPDTTWFVGGPDGIAPEVRKDADYVLSFGKMTFPHELAQVMLLEQLFRAVTIISHFPYHR